MYHYIVAANLPSLAHRSIPISSPSRRLHQLPGREAATSGSTDMPSVKKAAMAPRFAFKEETTTTIYEVLRTCSFAFWEDGLTNVGVYELWPREFGSPPAFKMILMISGELTSQATHRALLYVRTPGHFTSSAAPRASKRCGQTKYQIQEKQNAGSTAPPLQQGATTRLSEKWLLTLAVTLA